MYRLGYDIGGTFLDTPFSALCHKMTQHPPSPIRLPLAGSQGIMIVRMNAGRTLVNRQFTTLGGSRRRREYGWARHLLEGTEQRVAGAGAGDRWKFGSATADVPRRMRCVPEARGCCLDPLFTVIAGVVSRNEPWYDSGLR